MRAGEVVEKLGEQLESEGMLQVLAIPRARMPVVKFEHPATGEQQHGLHNQTQTSIEDERVECGYVAAMWAVLFIAKPAGFNKIAYA